MKDWTCIFSSARQQDAEMVKALLEHNDIQSVIVNKQDSFYKFGDCEVYVSRKDVIKAKFCISQSFENKNSGA